jgi:hypothetical protein
VRRTESLESESSHIAALVVLGLGVLSIWLIVLYDSVAAKVPLASGAQA